MTGYLARGTGCSATTSVDFGLYCRMPRSCAPGRTGEDGADESDRESEDTPACVESRALS